MDTAAHPELINTRFAYVSVSRASEDALSLGVTAEPIIDGMLIPWSNEFMRGTLWAVSHASAEAFSFEDYELLNSLADFASIILRHQHQEKSLRETERTKGVAEMAHKLAHRINNPLQNLTNTIFLALHSEENTAEHLVQAEADLRRLSQQVARLLNWSGRLEANDLAQDQKSLASSKITPH
jgi:hypothetical protein